MQEKEEGNADLAVAVAEGEFKASGQGRENNNMEEKVKEEKAKQNIFGRTTQRGSSCGGG